MRGWKNISGIIWTNISVPLGQRISGELMTLAGSFQRVPASFFPYPSVDAPSLNP